MSDALAGQIIATCGLVLVAMIGLGGTWLGVTHARTSRRVKTIVGQVQNDHEANLRDDLDGKHDDNRKLLLAIARDIAWIMRQHADLREELDDHIANTTERTTP